jgi:hypothetical protein
VRYNRNHSAWSKKPLARIILAVFQAVIPAGRTLRRGQTPGGGPALPSLIVKLFRDDQDVWRVLEAEQPCRSSWRNAANLAVVQPSQQVASPENPGFSGLRSPS